MSKYRALNETYGTYGKVKANKMPAALKIVFFLILEFFLYSCHLFCSDQKLPLSYERFQVRFEQFQDLLCIL